MTTWLDWAVDPPNPSLQLPGGYYDVIKSNGEVVLASIPYRDAVTLVEAHNRSLEQLEEALW